MEMVKISKVAGLALFIVAAGCSKLPRPPRIDVIAAHQNLGQVDPIEVNTINRAPFKAIYTDSGFVPPLYAHKKYPAPHRNLLFVALDDLIQKEFEAPLAKLYKKPVPPRIENIFWWMVAPKYKGFYDQVVRIPYDRFDFETLKRGLDYLENQQKPYDVFLLTHGIPNYLVTSKGRPILGWEEIGSLKGKLKYLDLVFLQACYGMRLAPDWHDAGARSVLSYTQLNINFFYPQLFIDVFREAGGDVELAKSRTDEAIDGFLKNSKLHRTLVSLVQKGKTMEEYLAETENPKLSVVSK